MFRTTQKLLKSDFTSRDLRLKLSICGSRTRAGHWVWCRSPACDRCRHYRSRLIADAAEAWSGQIICAHRLQRIEVATPRCDTPEHLLDGVGQIRRAMRRAYNYRQNLDERWASIQQYAVWTPVWDGSGWIARMQGIVYLGRVSEVRYLNELGDAFEAKLSSFDRPVVGRDVREHICRSLSSTSGLKNCKAFQLSGIYNAIDTRGGYKALIARRGMQATRP